MTRISKNRIKGTAKGIQRLTKFDKAMKNLEWIVKEKGGNRGDTLVRGEGFEIGFLMKLRIISWNIRGVNDVEKKKNGEDFLKEVHNGSGLPLGNKDEGDDRRGG